MRKHLSPFSKLRRFCLDGEEAANGLVPFIQKGRVSVYLVIQIILSLTVFLPSTFETVFQQSDPEVWDDSDGIVVGFWEASCFRSPV